MRTIHVILGLLSLLGWISCSSDNLRPLSAEEDSEFRGVLSGLGITLGGVSTAEMDIDWVPPLTSPVRSMVSRAAADLLGLADAKIGTQARRDFETIVEAAIARGDCQRVSGERLPVKGNSLSNFGGLTQHHVKASLSGERCPVEDFSEANVSVNASRTELQASFKRAIKVKGAELLALSDVSEILFETNDLKVTYDGGSRTMAGNLSLRSSLTSRKLGALSYYLEASGEGKVRTDKEEIGEGKGEIRFGIELKGYAGELRVTGTQTLDGTKTQLSPKYFVNGSEVSASDMKAYTDLLSP